MKEQNVLETIDYEENLEQAGEHISETEKTEDEKSPEAIMKNWFGDEDSICVEYSAELGDSLIDGQGKELYVDGDPLSELLDSSDLPYYKEVFLRRLFNNGLATWQSESLVGKVGEGCIAVLTGTDVKIYYASSVEQAGEKEDEVALENEESSESDNDSHDEQNKVFAVDLDREIVEYV